MKEEVEVVFEVVFESKLVKLVNAGVDLGLYRHLLSKARPPVRRAAPARS